MNETLTIRRVESSDAVAWDRFVDRRPESTVFHRYAWSRAVQRAYPHQPEHLLAIRGDRIVGLLPLFFVKSAFVGRVLVSIPYATYGGVLAASPEVEEKLFQAAQARSCSLNCEYIELRNLRAGSLDLPVLDRYDTFRKALPDDPDAVLPGLPKKARAAARHAAAEMSVVTGPDLLDAIYHLYAVTMRRLGSPNFSKRLFRALADEYGSDCHCLAVLENNTPVAGVVSFIHGNELTAYFSGSLPSRRGNNASNLMYLRLMEETVRLGLKIFDFNRTRRNNAGPYNFKRHLGFEPAPLPYQIALNKAASLPNLSPSNAKFALAGKIWRKLPLCLTQSAGAYVTRWIP